MSIRRFLNALRLLFIAVCVAAIGARVAWTRFPEQVERVDNWVVKTSEHRVRRELSRATKAKEAGESEVARKHLLKVADVTSDVKHGDRLEGLRQQALGYLRDQAASAGADEEALEWATQLHELNDRNTPNELARAKLLSRLGQHTESVVLFERLSYLAQGRADFDLPYFQALVDAGRGPDALRLLLRMREGAGLEVSDGPWELRQRVTGSPWSAAAFVDLASQDGGPTMEGKAALDAPVDTVRDLRVDLPRGASMVVRDMKVTLALASGAEFELGPDAVQRMNQLESMEGGFRASSASDPYVVFTVPELPAGDRVSEGRLSVKLTPILPEAIQSFFASDAGAAAIAAFEADFEGQSARQPIVPLTEEELALLPVMPDADLPPGFVSADVPQETLRARFNDLKEALRD